MKDRPVLVWFRQDLRLRDHAALSAAAAGGTRVIPVYVHSPDEEGEWIPGGASRWWLHHSLAGLDLELRSRGLRLLIRRGTAANVLRDLAAECGAEALFFSRRWEPAAGLQEEVVSERLKALGLAVQAFDGALLLAPGSVQRAGGGPYRVFTPYWKACLQHADPSPVLPAPEVLRGPRRWPRSLPLEALQLLPQPDWTGGLRATWQPGEEGAQRRLNAFVSGGLVDYEVGRDALGQDGISRLSPHLHFGELSPRQVWWATSRWMGGDAFVRQLGWREFGHHLLHHFPHTPTQTLRPEFAAFPWLEDGAALQAWQQGCTGYPLVDAGMRQLWQTGWMHNRARMVAASFLVKHLLIPWQEGARWFWDTLVDADLANNTMGWQWTAGCGADAAPYFRIFNPAVQGERFDAQGVYVRRWVPELERLPVAWVHRPGEAPAEVLAAAGVALGRTYPFPMVEHAMARQRALAALAQMKGGFTGR